MPRFSIRAQTLLAICVSCVQGATFTPKIVSSVEIFGAKAAAPLETQSGQALDSLKLRNDVKTLWNSGRYSDIRVDSIDDGEAVRIVFRVELKRPMAVRNVKVTPATPGINVDVQQGSEIDPLRAHTIAATVRRKLESTGYPFAKVEANLRPVSPGRVDLEVKIDRGQSVKIEKVSITGDSGSDGAAARKAVRWTNSKMMLPPIPGIWKGWRLTPDFSESAIQNDLHLLQSFYYSRGYFDADIRATTGDPAGDKVKVGFDVRPGPRYSIRQFELLGSGGTQRIRPEQGGGFPNRQICRSLLDERRRAEQQGVLDFAASIEVKEVLKVPVLEGSDGHKWADLTATIQRGPEYRIGQINFRGNHKFGDATIRRSLLLDEDGPLNQPLLRKSLARLNGTGLFDPLSETNVTINTPPGSDRADIIIRLQEKKARHWFVSGPIGSMNFAGPLQFAVGSRLPAWGQNLLELSTYTVSMNLMVFAKPLGQIIPGLSYGRFMTAVTIQRPLLPGQRFLSGFVIAPQLGWQGMLAGYAVSQARGALGGLLDSDRAYTPPLPVTFSIVSSTGPKQSLTGALSCERPKTKLDWTVQIAGIASRLIFSFYPF